MHIYMDTCIGVSEYVSMYAYVCLIILLFLETWAEIVMNKMI